ncbi:ComEA family DNA-binding protein [Nitriliruptor alkaliphilus]|uniref:ComEA family DNA-binding protein n=1 Tax=Nitriliruptor alkaliphilus TaxID=427918 RepID=UPI000697A871|nr:ComEA family DNA-binding protein [Nitriliruptor alkaliphilus]
MDLIGEERGRLARAASWFEATPAEVVGLAVLLVCAIGATGVLVWSALGRPALPDGAAMGAGDAGQVGAAAGPTGAAPGDAAAPEQPGGHEHHGDVDDPIDGPLGGQAANGEVTVHVAGAVAAPGVVTLPAGSRVTDAVDAAGGLLGDADPSRINLARPLEDGEQLLILREGEEPPEPPPGAAGGPTAADGAASGGGGPVDLNRATVEQLQSLPGIGPAIAARIVQHRDQHGPFRTPGDLRDVSGIGEKRFQDLADLVTVG